MGLLDDAVSAGQDAVDSGVDAVQGAGDAATDAAGDATDAATGAGEAYWDFSEDVADTVTFGVASDVQDWEQSTRDDRWDLYFGEGTSDGGFLDSAYTAADSWLAFGAAPGGSDVIGSGVVDDVLGGGGDSGNSSGNGNDGNGDGGSGLPSWVIPAAVIAAAGGYLVYGGEI